MRRPVLLFTLLLLLAPTGAAQPPAAWTEGPTLPVGLSGVAAVWDGRQAILFGGERPDGNLSDRIWLVSLPGGDVRTSASRLPTPRADVAAVWDGQTVHLLGGRDAGGALDEVLRYDPLTDTLRDAGVRLPEPRAGAAAVWAQGAAHLLGGAPCGPCAVLRYEPGDATEPASAEARNALVPSLLRAGVFWDGRAIHLLGGLEPLPGAEDAGGPDGATGDALGRAAVGNGTGDGTGDGAADAQPAEGRRATDVWRAYDPGADTVREVGRLPAAWHGPAAYDGGHGYLFGSPVLRVDTVGGTVQRLGPAPPAPADGAAAFAAPHGVWVLAAGPGHDRTLGFHPEAAYAAQQNAWCGLLRIDACTTPATAPGFPLYPLVGAFLLLVYLAAWGLPVRRMARRAGGRPAPAALAVLATAALLALVVQVAAWSGYAVQDEGASASAWGVRDGTTHAWWSGELSGLDGRLLALAGAVVFLLAWVAAGAAAALLWRRRGGTLVAWCAGAAATLGWFLVTYGQHRLARGALQSWGLGALLALVAIMLLGLGVFLWLRDPLPILPPGAPGAGRGVPPPGAPQAPRPPATVTAAPRPARPARPARGRAKPTAQPAAERGAITRGRPPGPRGVQRRGDLRRDEGPPRKA